MRERPHCESLDGVQELLEKDWQEIFMEIFKSKHAAFFLYFTQPPHPCPRVLDVGPATDRCLCVCERVIMEKR